jgi:hypothetical protein
MVEQFAPNVPEAQISFWTRPMVLLGDEAQLEYHFGPFGDSVSVRARWVHCLHQMYHGLENHFGHT